MKVQNSFLRKLRSSDLIILCGLALAKLIIHLISSTTYEFHRDEFLYIAMGKHLAWGYLEVPPFIAGVAAFVRVLPGESLLTYRLLTATAGAGSVVLTGLLARELGGKRFAQVVAALSVLISPALLRSGTLFQPVVFEQFFWVVGMYLVVNIFNNASSNQPAWWILLGIVGGVGLLNKYTMLMFAGGMFIGLLLSPQRTLLRSGWPWIAVMLALAIALPNLIWQHQQGWPLLEHLRVLSRTQLANVQPGQFLLMQVLMLLFAFPLVLLGLYYTLMTKQGWHYRPLGWMLLSILAVLLLLSGKAYYMMPVYPVLLAAGAVQLERFIQPSGGRWLRWIIPAVLVVGNAPAIPFGLPVLPPSAFESYAAIMTRLPGFDDPLRWEDGEIHDLPQDFADMIGWRNLASHIRRLSEQIPQDQRDRTILFASNYGEAGCLDYYRDEYGLPPVYSFHGSYYLWGPPEQEPETIITIGFHEETLREYFHEVSDGTIITHPHAREGRIPVYICPHPGNRLGTLWEEFAEYRY